ncbi:MAG: hypothetical protein DRO67_04990, partial [Candidatus Asgardarchaeum californiense]
PCKLLQDNKGNLYEINKIRYRLYTDVYVPYVGYYAYGDFSVKEIRAFEWKDEEPPSININRPKTPGVYFQNKKIYPLNEYRIMIGYSTVDVTFSDNIFIKKCEIKAGGLVLFSQNYDLYDEKQTLRLDDIPILEGSNRYRFSVTDFSDNEVNQEINIIGFLIDGPACLLSNPTGIDSGYTNTSYTFSVSAIDFEEDPIEYGWDWDGDGSVDEWTQSDSATYQWTSEGQFEVIVSVKEQNSGRLGLWTTSKTVNIEENTSPTSSDSIQSSQSNTAVPGMSIIPTNPSSTPSVGTTTFQTTSHASNSASSNTMNSGTFLR